MRAAILAATLCLIPFGVALGQAGSAQALKPCNGFEATQHGAKASFKATTAVEGSQKVVTFSLTLRDVASGQTVASPETKTPIGKTASVTQGEGPGALTVSFTPQAAGAASTIDLSYTGPDGASRNMRVSCTM